MQTLSFLVKRLREAGLRPATRYGQNFLIDMNLLQLLVDRAELSDPDVVLEVGGGTGSLTTRMAVKAGWVVSVEIDKHLHQLAREELAAHDNVTVLLQDALRNKNNIHPNVLKAVTERLTERPNGRLKLVANLPYNIATPILSNLLETPTVPASMTVTIQKELADRITAKPGTKDYSSLSIWVQSLCETELVRVLPPSVFWPRPKVHSAIIHVTPRPDKRARISDLPFFHQFVRAMFFHRRKFLRSVVASAYKGRLEKSEVDVILEDMKIGRETRAEQLDIETIQALSESVRIRVGAS